MSLRKLLPAVVLAIAGTAVDAQTTITTNGGSSVGFFGGSPFSRTFGQTFTTPTDNRLNSFSFFVAGRPSTLNFRAYVVAFDVDFLGRWRPTTSTPVFTSGLLSVTTNGEDLSRVDILTSGLALVAGQRYGAFLSTLDVVNSSTTGLIFSKGSDQYAGGEFVSFNGTTTAWNSEFWTGSQGEDLQFVLSFSPGGPTNVVPEPGTYALLGTGLLVMGAVGRRRRRA